VLVEELLETALVFLAGSVLLIDEGVLVDGRIPLFQGRTRPGMLGRILLVDDGRVNERIPLVKGRKQPGVLGRVFSLGTRHPICTRHLGQINL
jgi:hypothetical protein